MLIFIAALIFQFFKLLQLYGTEKVRNGLNCNDVPNVPSEKFKHTLVLPLSSNEQNPISRKENRLACRTAANAANANTRWKG